MMNKTPMTVLTAVSAVLLAGCEQSQKKDAPQAGQMPVMPVTVLEAKETEQVVRADLPGRLEPYRKAEVRARVPGILLKRNYEEGQDVKEGDLLFQIDPAPYKAMQEACIAAVQRAKANLANIQDKEQRYRPLAQKGMVSEREHTELVLQEKMALAELAAANAELKKVNLELGYTQVVSPINGRARAELVTEGALVGHGTPTPLTTVEQIDPIYVVFNQPVSDMIAARRGVRLEGWKGLNLDQIAIRLVLPDGTEYKEPGKLVFTDFSVDPGTDNVQMKAEFKNPDYELLPGTYVRVEFDRAVRESVFKIPRVAVSNTPQGAIVMVVGEGNIVQPRPIQTDGLEGDHWIVTGGLKNGDKVIVGKHLLNVVPGVKVQIEKVVNQESGSTQGKTE